MELFKTYAPYIGSGIAACIGTAIILRCWKHKKSERTPRVCGKDYPKDTVIVHDFAKGVFVPSIGHFVMKLETYLRIAKIPYEKSYDIGYTSYKGPKEKKPWIEYNGIEMGDSQQIINFLNKEFNVDLNKHLTPKERATSWAIQKWLEEFTYCFYLCPMLTSPNYAFMWRRLYNDKKYLMGDQPVEVDCAAYGQLVQILNTPDSIPGKIFMKENLPNLTAYCDRIKSLYWPDWDQYITGTPSL